MNSRSRSTLAHDWYPEPLPDNVVIGDRSWVYSSFAFLHYRSLQPCGLSVGCDSGIYNTSFFELGPDGEVRIGNYCAIVGAIINTNGRVVIDDYALIAHDVVIADDPFAVPAAAVGHAGRLVLDRREIHIGANAWIGARAVILGGAVIGEGAIVGAGAVVDFEVPAYTVVAGNPGRLVGSSRPLSSDHPIAADQG